MEVNKLLFRADGNAQIGLGHLFRCFALAEIYKSEFEIHFVTRSDSLLAVIPKEFNVVQIPLNIPLADEPEWISKIFSWEGCCIIIDGYQFNEYYQKQIKEKHYALVYIDDLVQGHQYADVVINHSPSVTKEEYEAEPSTKFALGTKYAILRPSFLEAAVESRTITDLNTCFVCFGGADIYNLSLKACQALLKFNNVKEINVVIGAANKYNEVAELSERYDHLKLHQNLSEKDLIAIMKKCNFAIVPSSTISYEICTVKMPIIGGYYVDNQKKIHQGLLNNNCVFDAGNFKHYSVADFERILIKFKKENRSLQYIENQAKMFDGKIKERFLLLLR